MNDQNGVQCDNVNEDCDDVTEGGSVPTSEYRLEHGAECTALVKTSLSCLSQLYETPTLSVDRQLGHSFKTPKVPCDCL